MAGSKVGGWLGLVVAVAGVALATASCGSTDGTASSYGKPVPEASTFDAGQISEAGQFGNEGGNGCVPKSCKDVGYTCGQNADGCGATLDCGSCTFPEFCGGGGFSKCGGNINIGKDGGPLCVPTTCATLGYGCGPAGDGCGGQLDCGTCHDPQYCGGGGFNQCGGNNGLQPDGAVPCTPTTCSALGYNCGTAADGCGGLLHCGTCTDPQYCGGGGFDVCGGNNGLQPDGSVPCTPTTCKALKYNCGVAADGCGGSLNCGSCANPEYCGGGGYDVCGGNNGLGGDGGVTCTPTDCTTLGYNCGVAADGCGGALNCGSCTNPEYCGGGGYDVCGGNNGKGPDGGVTCTPTTCAKLGYNCGVTGDGCGGQLDCGTCSLGYCGGGGFNVCGTTGLGSDGAVPCTPTNCATLGYTCGLASDGCGHAINCGTCTDPQYCGGGGYDVCGGNNGLGSDGGPTCTPTTCAKLGYTCGVAGDGCGGVLSCGNCTDPQYCGGGGFNVCGGNNGLGSDGGPTCVPTTCAALGFTCGTAGDGCGGTLSCGSCTDPQFCGGGGFNRCGGNNGLGGDGGPVCTPTTCAALGYTCGSAADGCGGVLSCGSCTNPQYCGGGGYDKCGGNNGLGGDGGPVCTPTTCAKLGYDCGTAGDGCGGTLSCGTCSVGYCGGGGFNVCGTSGLGSDGAVPCTPTTCAALGYNCGTAADGCGNLLVCGSCTNPQSCGGGGSYDVCGGNNGLGPDGGPLCTPTTCATLGFNCGSTGDGCGGLLNCGSCTDPAYCGGGGFNVCGGNNGLQPDGAPLCTPTTCAALGYTCGTAADGCGGTLSCGTCTNPQYCGGGGFDKCGGNNHLGPDGGPLCVPTTCAKLGFTCGQAGDGCGGTLVCGTCTDPQYCGGGGFNKCGGDNGLLPDGAVPCVPTTCAALGYNCGIAGDGCGGSLSCGSCTDPQYCGGGGYDVCGGNNGLGPDAGPVCTPTTCAALGYDCGVTGDGCGGQLSCGSCSGGQYCGGGGFNVCGTNGLSSDGAVPCTPTTCAVLGYTCGTAADGCGGTLSCGTCTNPQYCGGGGYDVCGGNNGLGTDGGPTCTPTTCAALGYNCGSAGDGCGGTLSCGSCTNPQYCGGGGFNYCGGNNGVGADGGPFCTPTSCAAQGFNCGQAGDGCGGTIDCGTCTNPQTCGGGGAFNQCGGNSGLGTDGGVTCVPTTCAALGYNCGFAADGCGGQLSCGSCTNPQYCGGGGYDVCGGDNGYAPDGGVACTPTTCAALGYNCGISGDGCGGTLNCGSCTSPQYCGGGGYEVCGPTSLSTCDGGSTTLTGFVYDPGNHLPINGATVYVPSGAVIQPTTGPTCGCSAPLSLTQATTGIDGSFTLNNVPSGTTVQVVVELGKWQITYTENVTACTANVLASHLTLPNKHSSTAGWPPNGNNGEGNIPLFAVDTGNVDTMECVLRKMGIVDAEFVDPAIAGGVPTAPGRVHFYQGSAYKGGARVDTSTPGESSLTDTTSVMNSYDVVLFPCQGGEATLGTNPGYDAAAETNLLNFANSGGRVFTTHYSYVWLYNNGSMAGSASWSLNAGTWGNNSYTGTIDQSFPRGATLASWLFQPAVGASTTLGQIPVSTVRQDFAAVFAPSQLWMTTDMSAATPARSATMPVHYTFDTPFNQSPSCGRVVFSDFHVENSGGSNAQFFPNECAAGALTPQEKLLEYMLFDLTSCVTQATCVPQTCAQLGFTCGPQGDGCGGQIDCGSCTAPQTCGGGGVNGQCGLPDGGTCVPTTCAALGFDCGPAGDGCGGLLACGSCTAPQTCGGGGSIGQCGYPDATACAPQTCVAQNITCGPAGDGCGNLIDCGTCTSPQTCGGGGVAGQCGYPDAGPCTSLTCAQQGIGCGPAGDGCGNALDCGGCVAPQTCGGGGVAGQCGYPASDACVPTTCAALGYTCGPAGDGCGGAIDCGPCTAPQTCGGGGVFNQCGYPEAGTCQPQSCAAQNITCGPAGDGCGGALSCGTCASPQTCGGGGVYGQCGFPDAGACTPLTCLQQGIDCGAAGDGCGGSLLCGTCASPLTCGGGGSPGVCGYPDGGSCVPQTCAGLGHTCGPAGDGCGGLLQCGTCASPQTCGGGGVYGQCGYPEAGACTPQTCAAQNITCGPAGDGCGGALSCGTCASPQTCGGGGTPGQCGFPDAGPCTPLTCAAQGIACGPAGDGCGNALTCGTCASPQSCGGGGTPGQCGYPDAAACVPQTCAQLNITCGPAGDGCGNSLYCGDCVAPATCGGGGVYGQCGYPEAGVCQPRTCAAQNITCGPAGDGCGGSLDCGACTAPQTCGGGGVYGQCGFPDAGNCAPQSCAAQNINCGPAGDGCGNTLQCGLCTSPQTCGGGGVYGQCGFPDGGACAPQTCAQQNINCGPAGDGCGGSLGCGTCSAPQTCGGGGTPGQCGFPDAGSCVPLTCAAQNITCGAAGDGCGNQLSCGSCGFPQTCGGGGVYGQCGFPDAGACAPQTCAQLGITCGPAGDGCGNSLQCGSCVAPQTCGGGGVYGQCGYPEAGVCQPRTCAQQNVGCGPAGDGCGGALDCGTCATGTCGGGGVYGQCGSPDAGCAPLSCAQQGLNCGPAGDGCGGVLACGTCTSPQQCGGGGVAGQCAIPDAGACTPQSCAQQGLNCGPAGDGCGGALDCGTCAAPLSCGGGGVFGVCGFPDAGACTPLTCSQQGITCGPAGDGCGNALSCGTCTSPQTCGGGGVFGQCGFPDAAACVPQTCAQLNIACGPAGDGCGNALSCGTCVAPATCGGGGVYGQCGYPEAGVCQPRTCAQQNVTCGPAGDGCGGALSCGTCVSPQTCGGGGVYGQCGFPDAGNCAPLTCAQQGITCGPAGDGCGNSLQCGSCTAPQTCGGGGVYGQCGFPDGGACTPKTCAQQGFICGPAGDGCGGALDCGACTSPQSCGGGGVYGQCGFPDAGACTPLTCAAQNIDCGPAGDGCGGTLQCGTCASPQTCGGGGVYGQCGFPDAGACVPETCAQLHITCGPAGDGCGNSLQCGACVAPQTCGGGGVYGQCGYPEAGVCSPRSCAQQLITCGPAGDGCGGALDCGTCPPGETCGGGGVHGQCGAPDGGGCAPLTCSQQGISCGPAGDGCGGTLQCGTCSGSQTCGGGGTPGVCGSPDGGTCAPETCAAQGIGCGPAGDGCGGTLQCGTCASPQTCGGGGVHGQCGYPDGGSCQAQTCAQQNISCGPAGDGCGGLLACGPCAAPQTCGGGGVFGQCGYPDGGSCQPQTCAQQNISCGPAGDGCGNQVDCGTCPSGQACGGGGTPGQCGTPDASTCVPLTCAQQNISCGPAGDGCGNLIQCGGCASPQTCGGGGLPGQCGGGAQ